MGRFEELYSKHAAAVYRYARSCVDRREIAEEIVSEAFLSLSQNLSHVEDRQLPAWLLTVTKRRAADYWRRWFLEAKQAKWMDDTGERSGPAEPGIPLTLWLERSRQLKPIHRACLILRYAHGMTRGEIAERLGLSETQVKGHLQYALELLRKDFERPSPGGER
jgi:RNA polymerase sigma-70 factor (ECF subfamily)